MNKLIIFIIVFSFSYLYTDDGSFMRFENPQGGTLVISNNSSITMASEIITYSNNYFSTVFKFINTSSVKQDVIIGFPIYGTFRGSGGPTEMDEVMYSETNQAKRLEAQYRIVKNYVNFQSFINEKEVERQIQYNFNGDTNEYSYIFYTTVNFDSLQKIIISNQYRQLPDYESYRWAVETNKLKYILKTGSSWKGPIGSVDIKITINNNAYYKINEGYGLRLDEIFYGSLPPAEITKDENNITFKWFYKDLIPTNDIEVFWGSKRIWGFDYGNPSGNCTNFNTNILIMLPQFVKNPEDETLKNQLKDYFVLFNNKKYFYSFIFSILPFADLRYLKYPPYNINLTRNTSTLLLNHEMIYNSVKAIQGYKISNEWTNLFNNLQWYTNGKSFYWLHPYEFAEISDFNSKIFLQLQHEQDQERDKIFDKYSILKKEAIKLYNDKKDKQAVERFKQALELYGGDGELYYFYGNSLSNIPDYQASLTAYDNALEYGYINYLVYYNKACIYSLIKDYSHTFDNLRSALMTGYTNINYILKDRDLINFRNDPSWKEFWNYKDKYMRR